MIRKPFGSSCSAFLDAKEPHSLAFYSSTNVLFSGEQPHSLDGEVKSDKKPLSCRV